MQHLMLATLAPLFALAAVVNTSPPTAPSTGAILFEHRCARCHGLNGDGEDGLAPSLRGIVGRARASLPDYTYSQGLKAMSGQWTVESLDVYLADPQAFAPGAEMDSRSPDPAERAAIIAYIREFKP